METIPLWVPVVFFAIAVVYAMVGLGGGSAYVAALAVMGFPYAAIPQVGLACNVLVTAGGVWHFRRAGHLSWRTCLPFVVASIPAAYLGGRIPIGPRPFALILGLALLAAGVRMLATPAARELRRMSTARAWALGVPVGAALGFVSGLVGIGGGVFLASVLVLARWTDARGAAGMVAVFTFANSVAGLAGQVNKGLLIGVAVVPLLLAAVIGGQIGSRLGARGLPVLRLRQVLSLLLIAVALRTLWGAWQA